MIIANTRMLPLSLSVLTILNVTKLLTERPAATPTLCASDAQEEAEMSHKAAAAVGCADRQAEILEGGVRGVSFASVVSTGEGD